MQQSVYTLVRQGRIPVLRLLGLQYDLDLICDIFTESQYYSSLYEESIYTTFSYIVYTDTTDNTQVFCG